MSENNEKNKVYSLAGRNDNIDTQFRRHELNEHQEYFTNTVMKMIDPAERKKDRDNYIEENKVHWNEEGQRYAELRKQANISVSAMAKGIGTTPTRIKRFEEGEPIMLPKQLKTSYELYIKYIELKEASRKIRTNRRM